MNDTKSYIAKHVPELDLSEFASAEIQEMESSFAGEYLFKFYPAESQFIFHDRTIRFTQKRGLNDPFELSRRWRSAGSRKIAEKLSNYMSTALNLLISDKEHIKEILIIEMKEKNIPISRSNIKKIDDFFSSPEGQYFLAKKSIEIKHLVELFTRMLFLNEEMIDRIILENFIEKIGVFSATDDINNILMWALYASAGAGYVITLNTNHNKFLISKGKNIGKSLFKKVKYTDDFIESFFDNPYYLWLVKDKKWEFENEWRMFKSLNECDNRDDVSGIYTDTLEKGCIKQIVFGYNFDKKNIDNIISNMNKFDSNIIFSKAKIDAVSKKIIVADI